MLDYKNDGQLLLICSTGEENNLRNLAEQVYQFILNFQYTSNKIPEKIGIQYRTFIGSTRVAYKTRVWDTAEAIYADLVS